VLHDRLEKLRDKLPDVIDWLEEAAQGAPIVCPECGHELAQRRIDPESCKYLVDRILGKPSSKVEVTIEERFALTADQCAAILQHGEAARVRFNALPAPSTALMLVEAEAQRGAE